MSIKAEIVSLISSDLQNSTEQALLNGVYEELKLSIQNPGVQTLFNKIFDEELSDETQNILRMICKKDLGFVPYVDKFSIMFVMMDFLN
jgi:hypothetical protein